MSDEKPKPIPYRGDNLQRQLTTNELALLRQKKLAVLNSILKKD